MGLQFVVIQEKIFCVIMVPYCTSVRHLPLNRFDVDNLKSSEKVSVTHFVYNFVVCFSISGIVLISLADKKMEARIPLGALWALGGALLYAVYLVLLRRRVDNEEKLNMPMFFGESVMHDINLSECSYSSFITCLFIFLFKILTKMLHSLSM